MKQNKIDVGRALGNSPDESCFWCTDGKILRNLEELGSALSSISDETYRYHANAERNDFSIWVNDIFGDEALAVKLRSCKTRQSASRLVKARVFALKNMNASTKNKKARK